MSRQYSPSNNPWDVGLKLTVQISFFTHHIKSPALVDERGNDEGGDGAGEEREVGVDERSVLLVTLHGPSIEARPVQPQENRT